MSIRVTCPKCHTRFNVSDQFAGKEGPCPKCKSKIRIPDKTEEVVIEAPKSGGPMGQDGRPILKPISRKETKLTGVQITLIAVFIIGFLATAIMMRIVTPDWTTFPTWMLVVAALVVAPPLVYAAYTFLRNQDLDSFLGNELWGRIVVCSLIYAVIWLAMPIACFAFNDKYETGSWVLAAVAMLGIGGATGMFCLDLDYIMGTVHYGLYMSIGLLGRWLAGLGVFPGNIPQVGPPAQVMLDVEQWGLAQPTLYSVAEMSAAFGNACLELAPCWVG